MGLPSLADEVDGLANFTANASGDGNQGLSKANIAIQSDGLSIGSQSVRNLAITGKLVNQGMEVQLESASWLSGRLTGAANWQDFLGSQEGSPISVKLNFERIQLHELPFPQWKPLQGVASGNLAFELRYDEDRISRWSTSGQAIAKDVVINGTRLGNVQADWSKDIQNSNGRLALGMGDEQGQFQSDIDLVFSNQDIRLMQGDFLESYHARGTLNNFAFSVAVPRLTNDLGVVASGNFDISGNHELWLERGRAELTSAETRFANGSIKLTTAILESQPSRISASKVLCRRSTRPHHRCSHFSPRSAGKSPVALPIQQSIGDALLECLCPVPFSWIGGKCEQFRGIEPSCGSRRGGLYRKTRRECHDIRFRATPIGDISFQGSMMNGLFEGEAEGMLLGGKATLSIAIQDIVSLFLNDQPKLSKISRVSGRVDEFDLSRLASVVMGPRSAQAISGTATFSSNMEIDGNRRLQALSVDFTLPHFIHGRRSIARDLEFRIEKDRNAIRLKQLSGSLGGGSLDASGVIHQKDDDPSSLTGELNYDVRQVDLGLMIDALNLNTSPELSGILSYRGRCRVDRDISLVGLASVARASMNGFPVQQMRSNLQINLGRNGKLRYLGANGLVGTAVGGQFTGDLRIRGGIVMSSGRPVPCDAARWNNSVMHSDSNEAWGTKTLMHPFSSIHAMRLLSTH